MTEVKILSNPLKVVKVSGVYEEKSTTTNDNYFNIPVVLPYMDISKGIWNLSLDTYIVKAKKPDQIETVVEVSSSGVTSYEFVEETGRHMSIPAPLGHIYTVVPKDNFIFGSFDKKWFTIDDTSFGLQLFLKQSKLSKVDELKFDFEITMLFQRQK